MTDTEAGKKATETGRGWFRAALTGQQTEAPAATPPPPVHPINAAIRRAAGRQANDEGSKQ